MSDGASVEAKAFLEAAERGNLQLVKSMFDGDVDVNSTDWLGNTALVSLVRERAQPSRAGQEPVEVARLLISSGADVDAVYTNSTIRMGIAGEGNLGHERGDQETTALMYALMKRWSTLSTMLIEAGAKVNVDYDYDSGLKHKSAVFEALFDDEVLRMMLERGAYANSTDYDRQYGAMGHTVLMAASSQGRLGAVRLLIDHGADVGAKRKDRATAFKLARGLAVKRVLLVARISRLFGRAKASPV